ncbi:multidrug ABC transporter substrate-binding protein [Betaproteobacteria bacterium]|nr:multidrug ABC transporter substrate-binding protein [Betaproteobacteria bacterium]
MRWSDLIHFSLHALGASRLRSVLTLSGIAVGIAAVIVLTSIGEGLSRFVLAEFSQFGTNIIQITPGKFDVHGGIPGLPSNARDLTLEDADALTRLPGVSAVSPIVNGNAEVRAQGRVRRALVMGVGPASHHMFAATLASGSFLPAGSVRDARTVVVLGAVLKQELFGDANALGARIQISGERYRVIGVMAPKGQFLGMDLDDCAYIPAARALALYRRDQVDEINVTYPEEMSPKPIIANIRTVLAARHGREDFTLSTQEEMLASLSNILDVLTIAVGALGGISLTVGAVGIVTIMTIAVAERTSEIGLLVALGARRREILILFLAEAVVLAALGGALGLVVGIGIATLASYLVPALPVATPWGFVLAAELLSVAIGLAAGVLPARSAARLNAVDALHTE